MPQTAVAYIATALALVLLDAVYLTQVGGPLFRTTVGDMAADKVALAPAVGFYLIYSFAVMALCVSPALGAGSWTRAAAAGAVLGLAAYGAYDLTNMATLKSWSLTLTLVDMAWGAGATAVSSAAGVFAARALVRAV